MFDETKVVRRVLRMRTERNGGLVAMDKIIGELDGDDGNDQVPILLPAKPAVVRQLDMDVPLGAPIGVP